VTDAISGAGGYVESGVSRWITFERRVERKCPPCPDLCNHPLKHYIASYRKLILGFVVDEVKSVLPPDESLTPGLIYVLISGLTASVLTRTRSLPLRFLSPPFFTLAAMPYFLPKTSHKIRSYLSDVEDEYFPGFAAQHDQFLANASTHTQQFLSRFGRVGEGAKGLGQRAVEGVENATGLKVGEAVRRGQERVEREKEKGHEVLPLEVKTVGYVVEQKPVAEIVVPVAPTPAKERVKREV